MGLSRAFARFPEVLRLTQLPASDRMRVLHPIQRLMRERVMHAPIFDSVSLHGAGPRLEEPGAGLVPLFAYFGPYEEMR